MAERQQPAGPVIDQARREQLRRHPAVRACRPERQIPFIPTLRAEGVDDIRKLLDRDDDERCEDDPEPQ